MIYLVSSPGETTYNYFTRLSQSFIQGKLYITENPPWLNELIPVNGKYFVVYPPMPALLMIPYVFIFGMHSSQTLFSIFLGAINSVLVFILFKRLNLNSKTSLLMTLLFALGTNHWYLASVGSAWFIAHITALFFLLLALVETFGKGRLLLIGFLLGVSFWARTTELFTIPFFYILFWRKFWPINGKNFYNFLLFNLGVIFFILLDAEYNFLRFGNFSVLAPYQLIPGISKDPIFQQGFMSLSYIPRHWDAVFFRLPLIKSTFPFIIPSLYSTALWFTSPLLIYALRVKRSLLTISCWVAILLTFLVISLWGGVGFAQFGYRFAQDFMPFLLILTALGIGQKPTKLAYLLMFLSILVNLWGVVMINHLQIWSL